MGIGKMLLIYLYLFQKTITKQNRQKKACVSKYIHVI